MMEYKPPIESVFDLQSYDEVAESPNGDSVRLRLEDHSGQCEVESRSSTIRPDITARLHPDRRIFPVKPPLSSQADKCEYISLELTPKERFKFHKTRSYHNVTIQTLAPLTHDGQHFEQVYSGIKTGLDVRLVKGDGRWTMYITDPEQKTYGTLSQATKDDCWLNGKNVDKGRPLYAADGGSFFFEDDEKRWHGFTPVREDDGTDQDDGGCWSAIECMKL
jgi:hypothetical protein